MWRRAASRWMEGGGGSQFSAKFKGPSASAHSAFQRPGASEGPGECWRVVGQCTMPSPTLSLMTSRAALPTLRGGSGAKGGKGCLQGRGEAIPISLEFVLRRRGGGHSSTAHASENGASVLRAVQQLAPVPRRLPVSLPACPWLFGWRSQAEPELSCRHFRLAASCRTHAVAAHCRGNAVSKNKNAVASPPRRHTSRATPGDAQPRRSNPLSPARSRFCVLH